MTRNWLPPLCPTLLLLYGTVWHALGKICSGMRNLFSGKMVANRFGEPMAHQCKGLDQWVARYWDLGQDWSFRKGDGTTQRFLYNCEFLPSKIIRWSPPWPLCGTRVQKLYKGGDPSVGRRLENSQLSSLVFGGRTRNEITQVPLPAMMWMNTVHPLDTTHHVSNKQLFSRLLPQFTSTSPRWSLPALSSRTMSLQQLGSKIWHGQSSLVSLEATAGMKLTFVPNYIDPIEWMKKPSQVAECVLHH